jgi:hypothetical protein
MTEQELSIEAIIRAVRQALQEYAPGTDPQDVEEFIDTLRDGDPEELEVNIGAGFGQFCEGEEACNAAFARYGQLIGAVKVVSNPSDS